MKSINMVCRGNELGRTVRPKENQQSMMNMSSHLSEEEAAQLANEIKVPWNDHSMAPLL